MQQQIFSQSYPINLTLLDLNQRLSLVGLMTILQDMSMRHAGELGHGYHDSLAKQEFWVFSQQRLKLIRMPIWGETLTVETWISEIGGISAVREFNLFVEGKIVGECAMQFMLLDQQTHRPKRLKGFAEHFDLRDEGILDFSAEKIRVNETPFLLRQHEVLVSDVDLNHHVNNTKYAQWLLDGLPITLHQHTVLREYSVNFLAQTFLGDKINCLCDTELKNHSDSNSETPKIITFKGERESDKKTLFTAQMHFSKREPS